MGDQKRIPRVVITSFFFFIPFRRRYLRLQTYPALCDVASSISQLFVPHFAMSAFACIFTISYNCTNKQTRPVVRILLNFLDFWSSKTITSILLLSVVLLKAMHAMTFRTKFLLFVSICVPPNNPMTACGATSFPGYHSFPKWVILCRCFTS